MHSIRWRSAAAFFHQADALGGGQPFDHFVKRAVHEVGELVQGEFDAVVGHAVFGEIIGADAFGAVAGADLAAALGGDCGVLAGLFGFEQAGTQHAHGFIAVFVLAAFVLALDDDAGWQMGDADGGLGFVDVLPACAGRAEGVDFEVGGVDLKVDLFGFGEDGDGDGRGMDAALAFGFGDALDAVDAGLKFEAGIRAVAADLENDFLAAAELGGALAEHID